MAFRGPPLATAISGAVCAFVHHEALLETTLQKLELFHPTLLNDDPLCVPDTITNMAKRPAFTQSEIIDSFFLDSDDENTTAHRNSNHEKGVLAAGEPRGALNGSLATQRARRESVKEDTERTARIVQEHAGHSQGIAQRPSAAKMSTGNEELARWPEKAVKSAKSLLESEPVAASRAHANGVSVALSPVLHREATAFHPKSYLATRAE